MKWFQKREMTGRNAQRNTAIIRKLLYIVDWSSSLVAYISLIEGYYVISVCKHNNNNKKCEKQYEKYGILM